MRTSWNMERPLGATAEKLERIDNNYKHYRDGWVFSVSYQEDLIIISAKNKTRLLSLRGGSEFCKQLYLYPSEKSTETLLASYRYSMSDKIFLLIYLFVLRIPWPIMLMWSVYLTFFSDKSLWIEGILMITVSLAATAIGYNWGKGRRKLESDRYKIIKEVLTKNGIDFLLKDEVKTNMDPARKSGH